MRTCARLSPLFWRLPCRPFCWPSHQSRVFASTVGRSGAQPGRSRRIARLHRAGAGRPFHSRSISVDGQGCRAGWMGRSTWRCPSARSASPAVPARRPPRRHQNPPPADHAPTCSADHRVTCCADHRATCCADRSSRPTASVAPARSVGSAPRGGQSMRGTSLRAHSLTRSLPQALTRRALIP